MYHHDINPILSLKDDEEAFPYNQPGINLLSNELNDKYNFNDNINFGIDYHDNIFCRQEDENEQNNFSDNSYVNNNKITQIEHYDSLSEDNKSYNKPTVDTSSLTKHSIHDNENISNMQSHMLLNRKKGRPLQDNRAIVINENKLIKPDDNISLYMKERKKIQNRESQIRSRQRKKEEVSKHNEKIDEIIKENERLKAENKTLIQDRNFLIEQIKFLQSLISNNVNSNSSNNSSSSCQVKHSTDISSLNKDKESLNITSTTNKKIFNTVEGAKNKISKLFSVGFVTLLGVLCILINIDTEEGIGFNTGNGYSVKSEYSKKGIVKSYSLSVRLISIFLFAASLIFVLYIYWKDFIRKRQKLK